ncbi:MAG: NUDIX domain-containing protein [Candidatus Roizmanbacteria bacterium]|nr:MAG: NUDIX domain-containing protein [Candidatus Roizmanbacteria bacterium]
MQIDQPLTEEEFKSIYSKVPRLAVEVIIKTPEGIVLTLRSIEPYKGTWHIPGGTVYYKETINEAIERVAKEELGVEVNIDRLLGYIEYPGEAKERGFGWPIGLAFLCTAKSGTLHGSEQGKTVGIFKELPENMIKEQKEFLKKIG